MENAAEGGPASAVDILLAVMDPGDCYHCGQAVATGVDLSVSIDGQARVMGCGGCQAVAQALIDNGLVDYYRNRDALPNAPR